VIIISATLTGIQKGTSWRTET